jgi:hypothetical protein
LKAREISRRNSLRSNIAENLKNERKYLEKKYETTLPTFLNLFDIMFRASYFSAKREYTSTELNAYNEEFISYVENLGYFFQKDRRRSNADINVFSNSKGFLVYTQRIENDNGKSVLLTSNLIIKNAPKDIADLYFGELTNNFRPIEKSEISPKKLKQKGDFDSGYYVQTGGTLYSVRIGEGDLWVSAMNNSEAIYSVCAEKTYVNTYKITPWTSTTDILIDKGDVINFKASGSITLGAFASLFGSRCYPDGIDGFRNYNIASNFNHGSLIGRIGRGDWFYIGRNRTITAKESGLLELRINDNKVNDDDGFFTVKYTIE